MLFNTRLSHKKSRGKLKTDSLDFFWGNLFYFEGICFFVRESVVSITANAEGVRARVPQARSHSRGVRGHAPPGKFWQNEGCRCILGACLEEIWYWFFWHFFKKFLDYFIFLLNSNFQDEVHNVLLAFFQHLVGWVWKWRSLFVKILSKKIFHIRYACTFIVYCAPPHLNFIICSPPHFFQPKSTSYMNIPLVLRTLQITVICLCIVVLLVFLTLSYHPSDN